MKFSTYKLVSSRPEQSKWAIRCALRNFKLATTLFPYASYTLLLLSTFNLRLRMMGKSMIALCEPSYNIKIKIFPKLP